MPDSKHELKSKVKQRKTFAIISHPDAGKTTLTEKLLLFGGAIRQAGSIKGRKSQKHATSDWMEIEKQRGISVTSSVMEFSYRGYQINILDTPGHQDFSEDTYRTLTAADSAVMLIDAAKGVEAQTIKLFDVCRMRGIPVFTFINKMDRFGKDPLDLLEEIEQVLGMRSCPMNWPVGMGSDFRGIYDRAHHRLELFEGEQKRTLIHTDSDEVDNPKFKSILGEAFHNKLCEDIELLDIAGDPFDEDKIKAGALTPVFFGSAITNFGVQTFLDQFIQLAPSPSARMSQTGPIDPVETPFSGFIFKIQANMNPAHRDRIAFLRICSGVFKRGMQVNHVRTGKRMKLAQPQQFMAQDRQIIEEAYPGDIIGLYDPGIFQIGDTLCETGSFKFEKLPSFPPEHFARVTIRDAMKHKQFEKGINQLTEEGAVQVYRTFIERTEDLILGAVGELQFQVFEYRLKQEYGVDVRLERLPYQFARWVTGENLEPRRLHSSNSLCVKDQDGNLVILFENEFSLRWLKEKHPSLSFHKNSYDIHDDIK
ncbi:MAG: peptide chain release factor 3 [Bacillaceae bacterium]|nr:peptide chain release factor 3 [Bacillaceae bacterium]